MSTGEDVGGLATIFAAVLGAVWAPWSERAKLRRQDKAVLRLIVRGDKAIPGLRQAIANLPERVGKNEQKIKGLEILFTSEFEKMRRGMGNLTKEVVDLKRLWTVNGGDTNSPADVQYRSALRTGDWKDEESKSDLP